MAIKVQSANNTIRVGVSTGSSGGNVQATYDPTEYYSNLARDWAIKMDGKVQEQDYSSKYYAQDSKNNAMLAMDIVTDFDDHVQQVENNFNTNAQNKIDEATIWAEGTDEQVQVLGGEHSAKGWTELGGRDIEDATTNQKGIIQIATEQEADEGLNTDKAMTPSLVSKEISDNVGRGIVLGFDGILENNVLTFAPADGIAYDLKNNYDYEIDLHFPAVGLLPDDTDIRIINGMDEIAIRNVLSGSLNATYGDLRQVCDYIEDIGWRWIFTARYKSINSDRAFVMQATTVALQQNLENASEHTVPSTKAVFDAIGTKDSGSSLVIGQIIFSLDPLIEDNLHLLDGSLLLVSGTYDEFITQYIEPLYNNQKLEKPNAKIIGAPTIQNGIASNFGESNYLLIPKTFQPGSNPWEMIWKVNTGSNWNLGDFSEIFGQGGGVNKYTPQLELDIINKHFNLMLAFSQDSTWTNVQSNTVEPNTDYFIKIEFTGNAYNIYTSLIKDFNNTPDGSLASTTPILQNDSSIIQIGNDQASAIAGRAWIGTIDLNYCYININNERWWSGMQNERFITESQWQEIVEQYGICDKYVYTEGIGVRLPKAGNKAYTTAPNQYVPSLGNDKTIGLTNGSNNYGIASANVQSGSYGLKAIEDLYGTNKGTAPTTNGTNTASNALGLTTDPNNSGIITDLSNAHNLVDGYWYIVVGTGSKTDIEVDLDNIATDLNNKADKDLVNITDSAKSVISRQAMPSGKCVPLTLGASLQTYVAPEDGYINIIRNANNANGYVGIGVLKNGVTVHSYENVAYSYGRYSAGVSDYVSLILPVEKGRSFYVDYAMSGTTNRFRFIYTVGSESEAQ